MSWFGEWFFCVLLLHYLEYFFFISSGLEWLTSKILGKNNMISLDSSYDLNNEKVWLKCVYLNFVFVQLRCNFNSKSTLTVMHCKLVIGNCKCNNTVIIWNRRVKKTATTVPFVYMTTVHTERDPYNHPTNIASAQFVQYKHREVTFIRFWFCFRMQISVNYKYCNICQ